MSNQRLIVIAGPTASGKTALAIRLAKHFDTCVLSADSRQFYREVAIGTAKPSLEEQDGVIHHFIDSHSLENPVSASMFAEEALLILTKIFQTKDIVILVGGSGLFMDALCVGLDKIPFNQEIRNQLNAELLQNGLDTLLLELHQKDPTYFAQVDRANATRVIRALEVIRNTGNTFTFYVENNTKEQRDFEFLYFIINHPREKLYARIEQRVDRMLASGLLEEVKSVYHLAHLQTLNTVGYSELFCFLRGEISFDTAILLIKQNTRRYAKRQLTWFRRYENAYWLESTEIELQLKEVLTNLK
jgi:tRNA dimethylallyltransferase